LTRHWTLLAALLTSALPARAEIAVLANGMTLKVRGQRLDGATLFLQLKEGGEVGVPFEMLRGLLPDEVIDEIDATGGAGDLHAQAAAAARRHGLDPGLVLAVVGVESAFEPRAVSPRGARGLMQLMPGTATSLGVADAFDPAQNLEAGARHLQSLVGRYAGDLPRALAAYNAGAGAVDRFGGVPPYRETRDYVRKVLRRYKPES